MDTWAVPASTAQSILIKPRSNLEEWLDDLDVDFPVSFDAQKIIGCHFHAHLKEFPEWTWYHTGTLEPLGNLQEPEEVCWICLDGDSAGHHGDQLLMTPCKCPRKVHPTCLARWQLQQVGNSEETHCRFCNHALNDWKVEMTPESLRNELEVVTPVMVVYFEGVIHRIPVIPGDEGLRDFELHIRKLFCLPEDSEISLTFGCKAPISGAHMNLEGARSYNAAVHCAKVAGAERLHQTKIYMAAKLPIPCSTATPSTASQALKPVASAAMHGSKFPILGCGSSRDPAPVIESNSTSHPEATATNQTSTVCLDLPNQIPGPILMCPVLNNSAPSPAQSTTRAGLPSHVLSHFAQHGQASPQAIFLARTGRPCRDSLHISSKETAAMVDNRNRAEKSWQQSVVQDRLRADEAASKAAAAQRADFFAQRRRETASQRFNVEQQPLRVGPSSSGGAEVSSRSEGDRGGGASGGGVRRFDGGTFCGQRGAEACGDNGGNVVGFQDARSGVWKDGLAPPIETPQDFIWGMRLSLVKKKRIGQGCVVM